MLKLVRTASWWAHLTCLLIVLITIFLAYPSRVLRQRISIPIILVRTMHVDPRFIVYTKPHAKLLAFNVGRTPTKYAFTEPLIQPYIFLKRKKKLHEEIRTDAKYCCKECIKSEVWTRKYGWESKSNNFKITTQVPLHDSDIARWFGFSSIIAQCAFEGPPKQQSAE